ncbi:HAD hydrolase family protein [Mycoplasmopsis iners]|uniref:HAD hydrolase family protein n=1 Tax=Mycoplasmopsis iners TaxID=76630 RepID=UPI0004966A3D|nr:HAD hydrolase family protein [Mycoplasmopsis iners]
MKKNYKAYFVDLDGTFIDQFDNPIYPVSQKNIEEAKKINQTKYLIISTGRSNSEFVMGLANKINSKYVICQNGAVIVDNNNNVLRMNVIDYDTSNRLKNFLENRNLSYTINGDPLIYTNNPESITLDRPWVREFKKVPYSQANLNQTINRFLAFGLPNVETTNKLSDEILKEFPELRTHKVSKGLSLEITNKNSTKGIGNLFICEKLGIDVKDAVHIGDSGNDIAVKEQGFDFIAMNNAIDSIKEYADFITVDYENGGVAKTIQELEK